MRSPRPLTMASWFCIAFISLVGLTAVANVAWITEDSFYTLRYVKNTLAGYGAVFNVGDYVQGYTHPLWFLWLLAGSFLFGDPVLVAIGSGLLLTLLYLLVLGVAIHRVVDDALIAILLFALAAGALVASEAWVSFQTSGLENALANLLMLLIICECVFNKLSHPARIVFLLTLLCLCRPDFVWFSLPLGAFAAWQLLRSDNLLPLFLAVLPGLLWLAGATFYYGYPLPNTGIAKLGIYPSYGAAINQGLTYLLDWVVHDVAAAIATFACLVVIALLRRDVLARLLLAGIVLQLLWVIATGGDFMRGRFLVVILVAATALAVLSLAEHYQDKERGNWKVLLAVLLVFATFGVTARVLRPPPPADMNLENPGIVNERLFYPGYTLATYLRLGHPDPGPDMTANIAMIAAYIQTCGPIALHWRNPATIGYMVGPQATIIDTLGLADSYIAALPRGLLVDDNPRPGHPDKYIPVRYLAKRGDLALVPGWVEKMRQRDCSLIDQVADFTDSELYISPGNDIVRLSFPQ